jgi:hypothetical protein
VPWKIHTREQTAARQSRLAYHEILQDALRDLKVPLGLLTQFGSRQLEPAEDEVDGVPVRR